MATFLSVSCALRSAPRSVSLLGALGSVEGRGGGLLPPPPLVPLVGGVGEKKRGFWRGGELRKEGNKGGKKYEFETQVEKKKDRIDLPGYKPFDPRTHHLSQQQHEWLKEFDKEMDKIEKERKGQEEAAKGKREQEEKEEEEKEWERVSDEQGLERERKLAEEKNEEKRKDHIKWQKERDEMMKEMQLENKMLLEHFGIDGGVDVDGLGGVGGAAGLGGVGGASAGGSGGGIQVEGDLGEEDENLTLQDLKEMAQQEPDPLDVLADTEEKEGISVRPPNPFGFVGLYTQQPFNLSDYKGKVVLLVNTACRSDKSGQLEQLDMVYRKYRERGLMVFCLPCGDFGAELPLNSQIKEHFIEQNFSFYATEKIHVKEGPQQHALFTWVGEFYPELLPESDFHKLLIGREGALRSVVPSCTSPLDSDLLELIEDLLDEQVGEDGEIIDEEEERQEEEIDEILEKKPTVPK